METEASANQENFFAANSKDIDNYGEVKVPAVTRERTLRGMNSSKPLLDQKQRSARNFES